MSGTKNKAGAKGQAQGKKPEGEASSRRADMVPAAPGPAVAVPAEMVRLQKLYAEVVRPAMQKEFAYANPM
jgi:large subunit ribosomal protein L5